MARVCSLLEAERGQGQDSGVRSGSGLWPGVRCQLWWDRGHGLREKVRFQGHGQRPGVTGQRSGHLRLDVRGHNSGPGIPIHMSEVKGYRAGFAGWCQGS